MPAPIIAAYEPYTEDRAPVLLALAAADLTGGAVTAVSVHPRPPTDTWAIPPIDDGAAERLVADAVARLHADLGVATETTGGASVPAALHALARERDAALIVVGSTARGRPGRVLTGSTAERLLQGAPCPVAIAPRGYERGEVTTIAVGFVDSPDGRAALTTAHALARRVGARLRVIAALHPSGGLDAAMAAGLRPARGAMLEGRHRTETQAILEAAVAALGDDVEVETELHVDDPADVLLAISEHVDLLVCGSRGYGPLRSVLLGGVSRRLVDESRCPVLVLPRGTEVSLEALANASGTATAR
jgi:nucleotide-binding universal stress UspA family protein